MEEEEHNTTTATATATTTTTKSNLKPMERRKKRKALDKYRHHSTDTQTLDPSKKPRIEYAPSTSVRELRIEAFGDLPSPHSDTREAAVDALAREIRAVQDAYVVTPSEDRDAGGVVPMEAEKDDGLGLENIAPSIRYALRRLVRGISSSRECARQGFALGLTHVLSSMPEIKVSSIMKIILEQLEMCSSMKGQEARDLLLGRLFAFGAVARSDRLTMEWTANKNTPCFDEFIKHLTSLAGKKQYLQEPAVVIILELINKLPVEAINHLLQTQSMLDWSIKAASDKLPDALFLALKLKEKVPLPSDFLGGLLPQPFSHDSFFSREHLSLLIPCFQESTFCQPRVHSLWPVLINILIPNVTSQEDALTCTSSSRKHKKIRKGTCDEELARNLCSFIEIAIEDSLLMSSHDRKHLAFDIVILLLPRLPASYIHIVLSHKLVQCLMDVLSTKGSWLYSAAQHFMKELINWVKDESDRLVAIIVSLQKHSSGRFDSITKTHTVKELILKFKTIQGCKQFVSSLKDLFVDEGGPPDELSDQSQTTDENGGIADEASQTLGNPDFLKNWIIETLPRVLKNLKLDSKEEDLASPDAATFSKDKFELQVEIMKFLAVQGLFSASLGTEVTSFELQDTFKWPKKANSNFVCKLCIEQLQFVMEDAQKEDSLNLVPCEVERNDLISHFVTLSNALCRIPSVSLFWTLSEDDDKAFKKLLEVERRLFNEERKTGPGVDCNKLHSLRYLLIQLLLQVLLQPGELSVAAADFVICCQKAFPGAFEGESLEEDELNNDDDSTPEMMNVLVETMLSVLPHASPRLSYAIEQVFKFFCSGITETGLLSLLRVIRKDLKPLRHQVTESDDENEDEDGDDFLGVEDEDMEVDNTDMGDVETDQTLDDVDGAEEQHGLEGSDEENEDEMGDDAMFRMDSYITQFLRKSGKSGNDTASAQLMLFKLRVLSLLEIFLQKNQGKPEVLMIFTHLTRAYVKYHSVNGCKQLGERIWGILLKKIFKVKEFPGGADVEIATLEKLLEKSLRSASRTHFKSVSQHAKNSTFWILKMIHAKKLSESELENVMKIFQHALLDYFNSKKCRLKPEFIKEIIQRQPWMAPLLFGFLLDKCAKVKSEFRRVEVLDLIDTIFKTCFSMKKGESDEDRARKSKCVKKHLPQMCLLIEEVVTKFPEKQARRAGVRRFCQKVFDAISRLQLTKSFFKFLNSDADAACQSHLGNLFTSFKNQNEVAKAQ